MILTKKGPAKKSQVLSYQRCRRRESNPHGTKYREAWPLIHLYLIICGYYWLLPDEYPTTYPSFHYCVEVPKDFEDVFFGEENG